MSIRPIDLQVSISKSQELTKPSDIGTDKYMAQDAFKHEVQKNTEKHMTEVNKSEEMDKLIDDDENSKNEYEDNNQDKNRSEAEKRRLAEERRLAEQKKAEYIRKVTNRGNLFDFDA